MRTWIKKAAVVCLLAGGAGLVFSQEVKRPEKETSEMKELRQRGEQLRIDRIKYAVKRGVIKSDRAAFMIKRIKFMSEFKNDNPDWVKQSRFGRRMHRRGNKCRMDRQGRMQGKRGDRMGGRKMGNRGKGMRSGMRDKKLDFWKNLSAETADMKKLRHQQRDMQISRIEFGVKQGFVDPTMAAYRIKKIKALHEFKDRNPEWVKYGRNFGGKGRRGAGHGGRGMRGCGR